MWVGGCVTAPVAWASGPSALASRGPWGRRCRGTRGPARSRERPWGRRSVHRSAKMASRRRFGAFVYTVATRVAIRIATRAASGGTSASTTMACRRRLLAGPSRLVGKTGSARVAPLPGWHLRRGVNPHEPLKSPDSWRSRPNSHCHSALSVPLRYDRHRVAVYGALPLAPERSSPYVHHRVAAWPALPPVPQCFYRVQGLLCSTTNIARSLCPHGAMGRRLRYERQ